MPTKNPFPSPALGIKGFFAATHRHAKPGGTCHRAEAGAKHLFRTFCWSCSYCPTRRRMRSCTGGWVLNSFAVHCEFSYRQHPTN